MRSIDFVRMTRYSYKPWPREAQYEWRRSWSYMSQKEFAGDTLVDAEVAICES
jgi:hypothetical protein